MRNVLTMILGGGRGTRLYPLTKYRSKPAVPLAAKYRLIDIPLSNCINSGINRIYVLTQFLSVSLHRHLRQTYRFDQFSGGFVELLAAQQTEGGNEHQDWYQGTYQGAPAEIFYSASCGGRSESASAVWARSNLPYLQSVRDDVHDDDEPWTV